ncbi:unnamed protein product [Calypogeia fissa]
MRRIVQLNQFLQDHSIKLNSGGGILKVSPDGGLLQSSSVADSLEYAFADFEVRRVPASYIEFAERLVLSVYSGLKDDEVLERHRRDGFEVGNADKIFESTSSGLVSQGQWFLAIDFVLRHPECLYDILLLSCAATTSQFFISYTIRTFGALVFATLMTTRQLLSIIISCVLFAHPLTAQQWGAAVVVFGALYSKSYLSSRKRGDKAVSLRPGSKDPEEEQLILPSKVGDMDASRQHVLVVKDMDIQGSRTS